MLTHFNKTQRAASRAAANREIAQRKSPLEEEKTLQGKFQTVQKMGVPEEEDLLQGKFKQPVQRQPNNTGLPDNLKSGIENLSGMGMDDVQVHFNSAKPSQLQAHAQSFHSENVDGFPNAITLALSKPVQKVTQLQRDAPIQFNDEEDAVREVRDKIPNGPGNLTTSSQEAKKRFHQAGKLENLLLITQNSNDESDENRGLLGLGGDALYRKNFMDKEGDQIKSVASHVGEEKKLDKPINGETFRGPLRKEQLEIVKGFESVIEIVWRDFVLEKTGGGSCDHISAATFLTLVGKGKTPALVSYIPRSNEEYEIKPPSEEYNRHRSVLVHEQKENEGQTIKDVDSWFPEEGRVDIFESLGAAKAKYEDAKVIWEWQLDDKFVIEFVNALKTEMGVRYNKIMADNKLKDGDGDPDSVKALWEITKKK